MTNFIIITTVEGSEVYVNPDNIATMRVEKIKGVKDKLTEICMTDNLHPIYTLETIGEITKSIWDCSVQPVRHETVYRN